MKRALLIAALWAAVLWLACILELEPRRTDIDFALIGFAWIVAASLSIVLARRARALFAQRQRSLAALSFLAPMAVMVACPIVMNTGWFEDYTVRYRRAYYLNRVREDGPILARIQSTRSLKLQNEICGDDCTVDPGPPVRVAFSLPGQYHEIDRAIVYDPTGLVMQANVYHPNWRWNDPRDHTSRLFGRTEESDEHMVDAEHLEGPWYLCGFF